MIVERKTQVNDGDFHVGDLLSFQMTDGSNTKSIAVKQEADGMLFCTVDCLGLFLPMNLIDSNMGGYAQSTLRKTLNRKASFLLPSILIRSAIPFPDGMSVRIPTEKEITGFNRYGEEEGHDVTQWEPMEDIRNRISLQRPQSGHGCAYWLQNVHVYSDSETAVIRAEKERIHSYRDRTDFVIVTGDGILSHRSASESYGVSVRIVFKLPNIILRESF